MFTDLFYYPEAYMINHQANLITGPVGRILIRLTAPMFFGLLAIISFNLADTFFVAKLGTEQLAAISFTFPIVMILMNLSLGLGIGSASVISRTIGKGDHHKVQRLTTDSLILALLIISPLILIGLFTIHPLFTFLGAGPDVLPYIHSYMAIWYFGVPFIVIPMVGNSALRASGNTKTPGMIMIFAALMNIILDPLLIFGLFGFPELGIGGAALATAISYGATFSISFFILYFRKDMITFSINLREMVASWREILSIGVPAALANLTIPVMNAFTLWLLAGYGSGVVGGYGIAARIESFCMIVLMAQSSALGPFIGQNFGARHIDRITAALRGSFQFSLFWGVFVAIVLYAGSDSIPAWFRRDPAVIHTASLYLRMVPISYAALGIIFLTHAFLNAIGKSVLAYITGLSRFFLYALFAGTGMVLLGIPGIFMGLILANALVAIGSYLYVRQTHLWSYEK